MKTNPKMLEHILPAEQMKADSQFIREADCSCPSCRPDLHRQLVQIGRDFTAVAYLCVDFSARCPVQAQVWRHLCSQDGVSRAGIQVHLHGLPNLAKLDARWNHGVL